MYDLNLDISHFPSQKDAEIWEITVGDLLRKVASENPNAIAMIDISENGDCGQSWTYSELFEQSERLAQSLATRFKAHERVVIWAPNIPEWVIMEYAAGLAGLILVTANPSFQASELRYVLEQSGAVGLFMVNEFRGNPMQEIAQEATAGNALLREIVNLENMEDLYSIGDNSTDLPDVQPDDPAQIQYTSGTTGFPKGATLSHKNLVNNARLFCARKQVGQHLSLIHI